jgi:hypothetical protein
MKNSRYRCDYEAPKQDIDIRIKEKEKSYKTGGKLCKRKREETAKINGLRSFLI